MTRYEVELTDEQALHHLSQWPFGITGGAVAGRRMTRSFSYAKCVTAGLVAFGRDGRTDHVASRAEVREALRRAETGPTGWAVCAGLTVHEDNLRLLLAELGTATT